MTFSFTDFVFLLSLSQKKGDGLGDVLAGTASYLGFALNEGAVNHALTVLRNAGYIEVPGDGDPLEVGASSDIRLTVVGRKAVTVPIWKKLLGRLNPTLHSLEKIFLSSSDLISDGGTVVLAPHVYDELVRCIEEPEDNGPDCLYVSVKQTPDGMVLHLHEPWAIEDAEEETETDAGEPEDRSELAALVGGSADDEYFPENNLTVVYAPSDKGFADLLRAVHELVMSEEAKTRKVCLHNEQGTYVLTLSPQIDGIRVTCAPIRFNQKRFRGKRDGELDYAQCGDDVLRFTLDENELVTMTDMAYSAVWEQLDDDLKQECNTLQ